MGWCRCLLQQMDRSIQKLDPKLNALVMEKQNLDRQWAVLGSPQMAVCEMAVTEVTSQLLVLI